MRILRQTLTSILPNTVHIHIGHQIVNKMSKEKQYLSVIHISDKDLSLANCPGQMK
jgi:5S rRNA maturation endonuclease (ribonuclease M5)